MSDYVKVKKTTKPYCQVCNKNFKNQEFVYYAPTDNNIVCIKCSEIHKNREPRIYVNE